MKATAKNSSQQILFWFAQQKKPCSTAQVHAALAPTETLRRFRGRISSLITAGKLVRKTVGKGKTTMVLAKDGLVDRRSPVARPLGAPPAPRYVPQPKQKAPAPADRVKQAKTRAALHSAAVANPPPARRADPLQLAQNPHMKGSASELIAADIAAFEARGGRIQKLANGVVSQPLRMSMADAMSAQAVRVSGQRKPRKPSPDVDGNAGK